MPRFFVADDLSQTDSILLDAKESRHAVNVLRLKPGELVELFDPKGHAARGIVAAKVGGRLKVSVDRTAGSQAAEVPAAAEIVLAASVIKPEAMDVLVQKSCELGAGRILPMLTERTVVRLSPERWRSKRERWQKIAVESCKQCGRDRVPEISPVSLFKDIVATLPAYGLALMPTLAVGGRSFYNTLISSKPSKRILVLIGPEGDFSAKEAAAAVSGGAVPVNLGRWVMRSETAALYTIACLGFYFNEPNAST